MLKADFSANRGLCPESFGQLFMWPRETRIKHISHPAILGLDDI